MRETGLRPASAVPPMRPLLRWVAPQLRRWVVSPARAVALVPQAVGWRARALPSTRTQLARARVA